MSTNLSINSEGEPKPNFVITFESPRYALISKISGLGGGGGFAPCGNDLIVNSV